MSSEEVAVPQPHVAIFTGGLLVVGEGQHFLTKTAVLLERLLGHLIPDVAD